MKNHEEIEEQIETISSWCPMFPGLYESVYMHSDIDIDEIDYFENDFDYNKDDSEKLTYKEKEFIVENMWKTKAYDNGVQDYTSSIVKTHCEVVAEKLTDILDCHVDIINSKLVSPKFYNYSTDSINCDIEIDINSVFSYLEENSKEWLEFCKERYTSCDGFISHYTPNEVFKVTLEMMEENGHFLGIVLEFIIDNEANQFGETVKDEIIRGVLENVYYSIWWEKIIEELQDELEEFRTENKGEKL